MLKRSIRIAGHNTSISLEPEFWDVLLLLAQQRQISLAQLVAEIDQNRAGNLCSSLRVYVLQSLLPKKD